MSAMRNQYHQNIVISIIGAVSIIIGAIIGIVPNIKDKKNNEIVVKVESLKKDIPSVFKSATPDPTTSTIEDGYISSVIDGLSGLSELLHGTNIRSETKVQSGELVSDRIRSQSEHRLSDHIFIRRISEVQEGMLVGDKKVLIITSDFDESFSEAVFIVEEGVLKSKPFGFGYVDLEHSINKAGIFVTRSTRENNDATSKMIITILRYEFDDNNEKRILETSGYGVY